MLVLFLHTDVEDGAQAPASSKSTGLVSVWLSRAVSSSFLSIEQDTKCRTVFPCVFSTVKVLDTSAALIAAKTLLFNGLSLESC